MKLFGYEYQPKRGILPNNQRQHRSFGNSGATTTTNSSNDQNPPSKTKWSKRLNDLLSRTSDTSFSYRLANLLFGMQEVRNPLGVRETNEHLETEKSSTSYLYDNETSSSHEPQDNEGYGYINTNNTNNNTNSHIFNQQYL